MSGELDRRGFVAACACAGAGLLMGCVSMVTHPVPVTDGRVRLTLANFPELADGGAIKIQPARLQDPLYVLALGEGRFGALSPICTHRGCTVDVQGARLVCPCHGSTYNREGEVLRGPAQRRLTRYTVTAENGVLIIDLNSAQS
jgi:cytochrome b6-f complex iron-sulfur subunit